MFSRCHCKARAAPRDEEYEKCGLAKEGEEFAHAQFDAQEA
jgi:hypothetical protein